jgi:hypothetical protein
MRRSLFARGVGATVLGASGLARVGATAFADTIPEGALTTQGALFDSLPRPVVHDWTRIILGSGVLYQKQIGVGEEIAADGSRLPYYELQVGSPGGSCNPSTMRKAYLKGSQFGSLFATYPLISNIGRTENMVYRYGDVEGGGTPAEHGDTTLRILDEDYLYDPRPLRIMSVAPQRIHVASTNLTATHVVGEFQGPATKQHRLVRMELWHSPLFPFGVARYRATVVGLAPFELHVYAHGHDFQSLLSMSLEKVRSITKNGQYGQIPISVGA